MISRSALIWLSRQEGLKDFATSFGVFKKLTTRFVAGETIDEAVNFIREINAEGLFGDLRSSERVSRQCCGSGSRSCRIPEHSLED